MACRTIFCSQRIIMSLSWKDVVTYWVEIISIFLFQFSCRVVFMRYFQTFLSHSPLKSKSKRAKTLQFFFRPETKQFFVLKVFSHAWHNFSSKQEHTYIIQFLDIFQMISLLSVLAICISHGLYIFKPLFEGQFQYFILTISFSTVSIQEQFIIRSGQPQDR